MPRATPVPQPNHMMKIRATTKTVKETLQILLDSDLEMLTSFTDTTVINTKEAKRTIVIELAECEDLDLSSSHYSVEPS